MSKKSDSTDSLKSCVAALTSGGVHRWRYALALVGKLGARAQEQAEEEGPPDGVAWPVLHPVEGLNGECRWN